jgi:hypothetical protein
LKIFCVMLALLLVGAVSGARKYPSAGKPPKEQPPALRIGLVEVRLGESKTELQNESSDLDVLKVTDILWEVGTPGGDDHAGTIIFTNGYVTYADREWLLKGSNAVDAILGAIDSFQQEGLRACVISHDTLPSPSAPTERATLNCGAKQLVVSKVNVIHPFGATEKSPGKKFEQITEVIGSK